MISSDKQIEHLSLEEKRNLAVRLLQAKKVGKSFSHPLSIGQQSLWIGHELAPQSAVYNINFAARIKGRLQVPALCRALQSLAERHSSLRSSIEVEDGKPFQRVNSEWKIGFDEIDGTTWSWELLLSRLDEETKRRIDLSGGSLWQVKLIKLAGGEQVLLLIFHHLIIDFWSLAIFLNELAILYARELTNRSTSLSPQEFDYGDFVRWQREMLEGAEGVRLREYWQRELAGELPALDLPLNKPRPAQRTYEGGACRFILNATLVDRIKALAKSEGATLYVVLLCAFQILLHRYAGQEEILVGSPTAGRSRSEFAGMIGYFINPVVVRARFSDKTTMRAAIAQVRRRVWGAVEHQDYPFSRIVEDLQPARDPSRSPFFQAMFTLERSQRPGCQGASLFVMGHAGAQMDLGTLVLESIELEQSTVEFDCSLVLEEVDDQLFASLQYNLDLFDAEMMSRMAMHYEILLDEMVNRPDVVVGQVGLLTEGERQQLLIELNDTARGEEREETLLSGYESQARRQPHGIAVVCGEQQLSYGELEQLGWRLATRLRGLGIGPESRVGVCLDRSIEMVVGLLGVIRAGGAYVPLDASHPMERLAWQIADAKVSVLLTQGRLRGLFEKMELDVMELDGEWWREDGREAAVGSEEASSGNLAYVIYTSGSTGRPKGVEIERRALANFLRSMAETPGLKQGDILLAVTTLSFDIAGLELWLPLREGIRLELASKEAVSDGDGLARLLRERAVTVMQATPATWRLLLAAGWEADQGMRILCGGESWERGLAERLSARGAGVWNVYGPTETTIWSAAKEVSNGPVLIGGALANTRLFILDENKNVAPSGVWGQLWIGGTGLARGYSGRPDLTAEKFQPEGMSEDDGQRLYATGDIARYLGDGRIELEGRLDHQVKVRGYRIEIGEVEAQLNRITGIRQGVVVAEKDRDGGSRLVGYLVMEPGKELEAEQLRQQLRAWLPEYMVPSILVSLAGIPLTANGKIDRRALSTIRPLEVRRQSQFVGPRNCIEEQVATIWSELLGIEQIGINKNFFELGGHSLLATQMLSRVRVAFRVELSMPRFFASPTIAGLSRAIARQQASHCDENSLVRMIEEIRNLSAQQVEAMLKAQREEAEEISED